MKIEVEESSNLKNLQFKEGTMNAENMTDCEVYHIYRTTNSLSANEPSATPSAVVEAHMKKDGQDLYNYYPFYAIHGSTGSIINLNSQLKRMADNFHVPMLCHGHIHRKYSERFEFKTVSS